MKCPSFVKSQSLISIENRLKSLPDSQNQLEKAFQEFQEQQNINLLSEEELNNNSGFRKESDKEKLLRILKDRRKQK
jgi:hypothetical protein